MSSKRTADQEALVAEARSFARDTLIPLTGSADEGALASAGYRAMWDACAAARYTGLPLSTSAGGRGLSLTDCMRVFESMAAAGADPGFLFSLGVHQFAVAVSVASIGSEDQRAQWLRQMAEGSCIGALAVSEPDAGSDTYAMKTRAEESADGFAISGEKIWISNAPVADLFVVLARTGDAPGMFGISSFLVPSTTKGLTIERGPAKAGLRNAPWGSVRLDRALVPKSNLLGGLGGGGAVFQSSMRWERCGLFAIALGAMRKSFGDCLAHVRHRTQFGKPLVDNDVVARSIALMKTRLEAARLLLYDAAAAIDDGEPDDAAVCLAKAYVGESAVANGLAAQELFGAAGVLEQSSATIFLNDMLPFRVLSGATDVQYKIATRLMLRAHP
ncbi:MAG TPA: acyl-CoA dehydrogenase family protein [Methyloceanibacter sp.]|nr:acyl-CoA dehydrogenase family protein [Methyloceanibacter sp.]